MYFSIYALKMLTKATGNEHQDGGRHHDEPRMCCFTVQINWFMTESGAELFTLSELHSKRTDLS